MHRLALRATIALAMTLLAPALASAQTPSLQAIQVADIETMKDKFVGLAQEFSDEQYEWRPMEGVRSVRDVIALMIAECHVFPTSWGHEPPARAADGFGPEMQRVSGMSKSELVRELEMAFDHLIGVVSGMDETERMADSEYFGRPMRIDANIMTAMADMHEHLGQLIAYARANRVVPPWSR